MEKLQILVTGANGLIGHKLCEKLLANGHEIVALSRSKHPDLLKSMLGNTNFRLVSGTDGVRLTVTRHGIALS